MTAPAGRPTEARHPVDRADDDTTAGGGLRVLHAIGEMGTGGAESLVVELVRGGSRYGWRSAVASAGGWREQELHDAAAGVHRVPLSRRRLDGLARAVLATRRAIRQSDPDVVVAHNVGVTMATWLALRSLRHRAPMLSVFHGVAAADYPNAARVLSRCPDVVVTVSGTILDRLVRAGLRPRRTEVIRNAISTPVLPDRAKARAELGLAEGDRVALCAARLVDQKRHDVLLRAWARLGTPATLLVAGDGPNRAQVAALGHQLGLGDRVRLLGVRDDMPRLLAAADVATLASDWEGLPVAVLEAMAAGLPIVATSVDGVAEAVGHGGGLLVPPGDPEALARALTRMLTDDPMRAAASEAARRVIATHYNPDTMVAGYDRLLRSLVSRQSLEPTDGARSA